MPVATARRRQKAADVTDITEMAVAFQSIVIALRRVARRVSRQNLPELPASESELLTLVAEMKGIGVNEAARQLQVSPNTVSTLVRSLSRRGLLERLSDPADRRVALLHLTAAGVARKQQASRQRAEAMTNAMLALGEKDRSAVANAIPAMRQLLVELERLGFDR